MYDKFEMANKETFRNNNGLSSSSNICWSNWTCPSVQDILARRNNETFKNNNGAYPDRPY